MAPRAKTKKKDPNADYERCTFICGPITRASVVQAAKDQKRPKVSAFLRFIAEDWLQSNGYDVDVP